LSKQLADTFRDSPNGESDGVNGLFIVVSAPSGTGKTSICREFLNRSRNNVHFSVSHTTRPPRSGERNGIDYHFIAESTFRNEIDQGAFVEWAENFGYLYGTSFNAINASLDRGMDLLLDVDTRGAKALKQHFSGVFVFILPPSLEALKARLTRRGETPDVMQRRLARAMDEIREVMWYDYVIINENLNEAIDQLSAIYRAEKIRRERMTHKINEFINDQEDEGEHGKNYC
jgi:guanylate kinase